MRFLHRLSRNSLPVCWPALALAGGLLTGCAASGPKEAASVQALEHYLQEAGRAAAAGRNEQAREVYRTAAKAHPASKEPWLRLAQGHFDTGDYGQAISASQEALQRDPSDRQAVGLLVLSGMRVSNAALSALPQQQNVLGEGARGEAADLARLLRGALVEASPETARAQIPPRSLATPPASRPKPAVRKPPVAATPLAAAPVAAGVPAAPALASAQPAARAFDDPFKVLGR